MWIICCGMFRSASTLHYNITAEIVEKAGRGKRLGFLTDVRLLTEHANTTGYKVIKGHRYAPEYDVLVERSEILPIYVYRDLRDVAISWMQMQRLSFIEADILNFLDEILQDYQRWTVLDPILISQYEHLVEAPLVDEISKIAAYLQIELTPAQISEIATNNQLDSQRQRIATFDFAEQGIPNGPTTYDPYTLLHDQHIHSGEVSRWKQALTPLEIMLIEEYFGDWLDARGYPLVYDRATLDYADQYRKKRAEALRT